MPATIRTTVVALVAAIGVTAPMLAVVPAANATKNTGAFWKSSAASKLTYCDQLFDQFQNNVNDASAADHAGKTNQMRVSLKEATAFLHSAQSLGCDWT